MSNLMLLSTVLISAFAVLAAIDGLYFHLWKYRLHTWSDTRWEHQLHTARAVLFPGVVLLLYAENTGGLALWTAVALIATDIGIQLVDMLIERDARARWGGLSSNEYAVHVVLTGLHAAAIALALASKPLSAWALSAPLVLAGEQCSLATTAANIILPGAMAIAVLHLWLCRRRFLVDGIEVGARALSR